MAFGGLMALINLNFDVKKGTIKAIIGPYEALVIRSGTKVTAELLEAAQNLKVIGRAGIGLDNVDIPAASKRGIVVALGRRVSRPTVVVPELDEFAAVLTDRPVKDAEAVARPGAAS